jgi:hypothetical protein
MRYEKHEKHEGDETKTVSLTVTFILPTPGRGAALGRAQA